MSSISKRRARLLSAAMMITASCAMDSASARPVSALTIDLRATQVNSTTIGPTKSVGGLGVGDAVTIEVWAQSTSAQPIQYQCVQDVFASFLSSGGSMRGNLSIPGGRIAPFNGLASSVGTVTDLDADGDLDIGSNSTDSAEAKDFFFARASQLIGPHSNNPDGSPISTLLVHDIPGGAEYLISRLRFVVTNVPDPSASTSVRFRARPSGVASVWTEGTPEAAEPIFDSDGNRTGTYYSYFGGLTNTSIVAGDPVLLSSVPEPAGPLASVFGGALLVMRMRKPRH